MEDSILISIKKLLGIPKEYEHFDTDIIMHINSVFMILQQLGVGPVEGFHIENDSDTWEDYLEDSSQLHIVRSYMYLKVRLLFDPPASSTHMNAINQQISEFEWRLNVAVDPTQSH